MNEGRGFSKVRAKAGSLHICPTVMSFSERKEMRRGLLSCREMREKENGREGAGGRDPFYTLRVPDPPRVHRLKADMIHLHFTSARYYKCASRIDIEILLLFTSQKASAPF